MTSPRIIQRSPNLGIGIRLQRLVDKPTVVPKDHPKPPAWRGWYDATGNPASDVESVWDGAAVVGQPSYSPGVWVGVVDGSSAVAWDIVFIPMIWFRAPDQDKVRLAWSGSGIEWSVSSQGECPFDFSLTSLPDPLSTPEVPYSQVTALADYWSGPVGPIPMAVAAGNTLIVTQSSVGVSGTLIAKARVSGVVVGSVSLTLKRVCFIRPM
jgi:hypothetical protein